MLNASNLSIVEDSPNIDYLYPDCAISYNHYGNFCNTIVVAVAL